MHLPVLTHLLEKTSGGALHFVLSGLHRNAVHFFTLFSGLILMLRGKFTSEWESVHSVTKDKKKKHFSICFPFHCDTVNA